MGYGHNPFGTPDQWLTVVTLVLVMTIGYGLLRGCEAGCGYVGRHVNVEWVK